MTQEKNEFSSLDPLLKKFSKYSNLRSWSAIMLGSSVLFVLASIVFHSIPLLVIAIVVVSVSSPLLIVSDNKAEEYVRKINQESFNLFLNSILKFFQNRDK